MKVYSSSPSNIVVELNRQRKEFKKPELNHLAENLKLVGQLQPGVCRKDQEKIVLVAGERRLRACEIAGIEFCYTLYEEMDNHTAKLAELCENLERENLTWQEECFAVMELHQLMEEKHGIAGPGRDTGHSQTDTGKMIAKSQAYVQESIELSLWAKELSEVKTCPNKTEARKLIKRLKEQVQLKDALDTAIEKSQVVQEQQAPVTNGVKTKISLRPYSETATPPTAEEVEGKKLMHYMNNCRQGDMREELKTLNKLFDVVLFDPPWGVDFDKVSLNNNASHMYKDSKDAFINSLKPDLQSLYNVMSPNSHLYMFFGIVHHQLVYDTLEEVGFTVNRQPIIWKKRGAHRTRQPNVWPGRCYEPIAFARKGSKNLVLKGEPDVIETSMPTPSIKSNHPSAKHPDIYRELLKRSCMPGDKVLDPMAGSGMMAVAAESLITSHVLDWTIIEQDENFYNLCLFNLMRGYHAIISNTELIDSDAIENRWEGISFKELEIGSDEWKEYWKDHPEEQDEMLKFKKERN